MIQAKHHRWVKQKKKKVRKGDSMHRKIWSWDCNGLKVHVAASGTSADDLGLILANFTVAVSEEQGIPMELSYTRCLQRLTSSASPLCGQHLIVTCLAWAPENAVLLDVLVHAASHRSFTEVCLASVKRVSLAHAVSRAKSKWHFWFCAVAHSSSLTRTRAHLECLFLKLLSKTVKLKLYQFGSAGLHCWSPSQQHYHEYSNLFSWHSFSVIR